MKKITFTVHGNAKPAGSKTAVRNKHGQVVGQRDSSGHKGEDWRKMVSQEAGVIMRGRPLFIGVPLMLTVTFFRPRPQSHLRTNGELKPTAPKYPISKPDATKLVRGAEDAMKGVVYFDDALIVDQHVYKRFGNARAEIVVEVIED